jgi:protein-tyrosine-phosphatase
MNWLARTIFAWMVVVIAACAARPSSAEDPTEQVLFVCEHGNVKSLMAASYFNQLAQQRGLPFRGVSRGSAPDSTTVPPAIAKALATEGFDVSDFHPVAVGTADVSASKRVIAIGTALPASVDASDGKVEQWNDVPPASTDYDASRTSLREHVRELIERLAHPAPN